MDSYAAETMLKGNLVVAQTIATDEGPKIVKRQIVFNEDGTCSWTKVT